MCVSVEACGCMGVLVCVSGDACGCMGVLVCVWGGACGCALKPFNVSGECMGVGVC